MKGNIYANKCVCGGKMIHDKARHNCFCAECGAAAYKGYIVRFGREISKRFSTYPAAARFLSGLRFKEDEGTLDVRDYRGDNPLAFKTQSARWLAIKEKEVGYETLRKYKRFIKKACDVWGNRNVKTISFGDIQDFLHTDQFPSDKYRHDARSCLNHFFDWLVDREDIKKPKFPKVNFELGWRTLTDLDTQQAIIAEVYRIAPQEKIAFGIELLATYTSLRPDDLRRIAEKDYRDGVIRFERPTKRKNKGKLVQLLDEHAETWERLRAQHPALPHMPFFRHHNQSGVRSESHYGKDLFYKWWKKACANLGIEGLDLYGGTRHSTTTAIAEMVDSATAKQASEHETNKAFERYCQAGNKAALAAAKLVKTKRDGVVQQLYNHKRKREPAK